MTREKVLVDAVNNCLQELYKYTIPSISWNAFEHDCEIYSDNYRKWEEERKNDYTNCPEWKDKPITECIGPKPFEFYFLPKEIMKDICDSYVSTYKLDSQQNLLDIIDILKSYCKEPIVDKYIEGELQEDGTRSPGHRGYEHPANLKEKIKEYLEENYPEDVDISEKMSEDIQDKFFEFLDMAGKFFNWNRELNTFNMSVYLGASPNSNKEAVIENWKKYKGVDITIDEEQMIKDYYEEE